MKTVRMIFTVVGALWFIGMLAIGLGGTYLSQNPDKAAAYAVASMGVDRNAGMLDQAGQMAGNYSDASSAINASRNAEARMQADAARRAVVQQGWGEESATGRGWSDDASASSEYYAE